MLRHKYNARKIVNEHGKFDSSLEYDVYLYLLEHERKGNISDLHRQVEFEVIPKQIVYKRKELKTKVRYDARTIRPVSYIADFTYIDNLGNLHVADAKGQRLSEYIIKKKAMLLTRKVFVEEWSRKKRGEPFTVSVSYTKEFIEDCPMNVLPSAFQEVKVI